MTRGRGRTLIAAAVPAAASIVLVASSFAGNRAAPVTVSVTARDYSFALSARTAPVGKVSFAVTNAGRRDHSFQIAGRTTAPLKPGRSAALVVTFTRPGPFAYASAVAGDAAKGMKGTFRTKAVATPVNADGRSVFVGYCGSCHTFAAGGSHGTVGPDLDGSTESTAAITIVVVSGKGLMPGIPSLTRRQIQDVASFVTQSRTG